MNHWSIHSALAGVLMLVACDNKETEWKIHLAAASEGVDRLVVEPLLMSDDKKLSSFEIKGADKIKSLIELIEIDAAHSGYSCNCDGDHRFRFYKGDMLVLTLHYLHGNALRWPEGKWKGDALLTEATQEAMPLWFRKRGFPALQEMRESRIAQMKREEEERTRFVACFPEKARAYFQPSASSALDFAQSDERSGQKLAESIADSEQVALAVCRAFGTLAGQASSWSSTSDKERRALAAIQSIKGDSFLSALEKLKGDRQALLGAARMFFWEQFNEKLPMEKRAEWSVRLAKVTLTDGWDGNKPITLWRLGLDDDSQVMTLLRDVFRGKVGKEMDSPKAGNQEPGLRASAAVILAQKDDQSIKEDVKQLRKAVKLPQDIAACDVALAIFGDPSCIKKEYFRFESYTIGLGELRAIENFKGTHGMEALVKGAIHHPWGRVREEAENTFARIVGKKLDAEEIEAWWEEHQVGKEAYTAKRFKGLVFNLDGNTDQIRMATVSPDGKYIAAGSNDSTAKIWAAASGKKLFTLRGHTFTVLCVAFDPGSQRLATGSQGVIKIWDIASGKELLSLEGHEHMVLQVAFSPEGKYLASASEDRTVRTWDPSTGKEVRCFRGHSQRVNCLAFHPDQRRIISASSDGTIKIWDHQTGKEERTIRQRLTAMALSPNGSQLAGGLEDGTIKLWNVDSGAELASWRGHSSWISGLAFSPDRKQLASGGWDKAIRIWDLTTHKEIHSITGHVKWVNSVAYSPDGKRLATASEDKTVKIWDIAKAIGSE